MIVSSSDWILENLETTERLQILARELGASADDGDAFIAMLEKGMTGDPELRKGAMRFLRKLPAIRTWEIDRALITAGGVDFTFAIALLCALTSTDQERDAEAGVDLDLILPAFGHAILDLHAFFIEEAWEINVTVPLNDDVIWIRDMRDSDRYPHPHLDFLEGEAPEVMIATCQGKSLKTYVSHPVLDPYEITVHSIEQEDEKYMMELESDKNCEMDLDGLLKA